MRTSLILLLSIFFFISCTDLEEEVLDEALNTDLIEGEGYEEGLLAAVYSSNDDLYTHYGYNFGLQEFSTDEAMIPTRVTDWDDNGTYRDLHLFTWTPFHSIVNRTWNSLNQGIARSTQALATLSGSGSPLRDQYMAEARAMGAMFMHNMLDLYGVVLYRDPETLNFNEAPIILRGQAAVDLVITEFEASLGDLPSRNDGGLGQGRMTVEAASGLLARVYLNKAVYENVYASTFNFAGEDMQEVINLTTNVINSGAHTLETADYFSMFDVGNENHPEHVFVVDQRTETKIGDNRFAVVTYSRGQRPTPRTRPFNGACTTPGFLDTWEGNTDDPRYYKQEFLQDGSVTRLPSPDFETGDFFRFNRGFQEGQQYGPVLDDTGSDFKRDENDPSLLVIEPLTNFRDDNLVIFTRTFESIFTTQAAGVRVFKYEFDPANGSATQGGVDIPLLRYADIYLMRAEAKLRTGDNAGALADVNTVREARGASLLNTLDLEAMYNERGYELYWEQVRRPDMIRFGTYDAPRFFKESSAVTYRLFPIPQSAIDANRALEQNDGY